MAYEGLKLASDVSNRLAAQRAKAGLPAACATSTPRAAGPLPSGRYTQTDIDRAVNAAVHSERCRVANVFGSQASHGRERICAKLLAHPAGWASSFIITELPNLAGGNAGKPAPKASRQVQASKPAPSASASEAWDRAYDRAFGKSAAPAPAAASTDPWDRAIAQLGKRA